MTTLAKIRKKPKMWGKKILSKCILKTNKMENHNLNDLNAKMLRALAGVGGVKRYSRMNKTKLREAIKPENIEYNDLTIP